MAIFSRQKTRNTSGIFTRRTTSGGIFNKRTTGGGPDLKTSSGLYQYAIDSGLKKDADRALASQAGEDNKKIFSGGFISDIFDSLNALSYGVVGMIKGKSFSEGVKTRQSFSDKDALGKFGLPGVISGIALDIGTDPLTYIAPWTIAKKVPGAVKAGRAVKAALFGKNVIKSGAIDDTKKLTQLFQEREGGTKTGKYLADKFVWMFGRDPIYKAMYEKSIRNIAIGTQNIAKITRGIGNFSQETASKILTRDATNRFTRVKLNELKGVLNPEEFGLVEQAWKKIDNLGQEAVDAGLLSKSKFEDNVGEYIKNAYLEYEQAGKKGVFSRIKTGIFGTKKRVEGLSKARMEELGQIDNPAYLLFKSVFDLTKDVENAKLFKLVNKSFAGSAVGKTAKQMADLGYKQLPETQRLVSSAGLQTDIMKNIGEVNQKLFPALKALKITFKGDKRVLSEIRGAEKMMASVGKMRAEEFFKFFQEGLDVEKVIAKTTSIKGVGKLPENLDILGNKVRKFLIKDTKKNLMKSDIGKEIDKVFVSGELERTGFKTVEKFVDYIQNPFKVKPEKIAKSTLKGNVKKLIKLQSKIEKLSRKAKGLKEVDKRSIDDAFRFWEETISKLTTKKENLIEQLGKVKLGDLSGKWVPSNIHDAIQEVSAPVKRMFGEKVMGNFKFFKVVMNPATHARNIVSNQLLNWWKLGMNPLDPRTIKANAEAIGEIARKGGKWIDEAKAVGYNIDTMAANELFHIMDSPEALGIGKNIGARWNKIKRKLGDIYQGEENVAKLSAFIFNRKHKGLGIEDAWKAAESATFNYAQVTPFVRRLRTAAWGFPFITFTLKATPLAAKTALKHPQRISSIGKIKQAIETQSDIKTTERERASEPQWIKDGFYVKLPMKDKHGRSSYFDLTYIIPFGDMISGNFVERQVSRETGLPESTAGAALGKAPLFQFIKEISRNQDFFGDKIWKDSDTQKKQLGDLMRHMTKTYLPPLVADQIPGGHKQDGTRRQKGIPGGITATPENQQRTLMQEMLRNVGAKIQPINVDMQEMFQEWNKKKAMMSLLEEKTSLSQFKIPFIPKER